MYKPACRNCIIMAVFSPGKSCRNNKISGHGGSNIGHAVIRWESKAEMARRII